VDTSKQEPSGWNIKVFEPDRKHVEVLLEQNFKLCLSVLLMKMIQLLTQHSVMMLTQNSLETDTCNNHKNNVFKNEPMN